jgi:hypothetical protein
MRLAVLVALTTISAAGAAFAVPVATPATDSATSICMKAAAATDHVALTDVDKDACQCATKQLHGVLKPSDFALHEQMLEILASGADEKSFNKQLSDIMLNRGMTQKDADAFLARSKAAEEKAQAVCNNSPLLAPEPAPKAGH